MRQLIQAATCKSEEFNDFVQWVLFGGEGVIAENLRHEQRKIIKYNHPVANLLILYNVSAMTKTIGELVEKGYRIDGKTLAGLAPFRRGHINRFGNYVMDMDREIQPFEYKLQFFADAN